MKSIKYMFFLLMLGFAACGDSFDESIEEINEDLFNINVILNKNTERYSYAFGRLGIEDGIWIVKEADHALVSEVTFDEDRNAAYNYQPQKDFKGNDSVTVDRCFSPGDATCFRTVRYNFSFNVK